MTRNVLALALTLLSLCALPGAVRAQQMPAVSVTPEAAGTAYRESRYQAALTLEVLPLDAQVLLDGKPIGTGRQLVAIGVPVLPGWHTVEIMADGYHPYTGHFVADQHSSATLFVVSLAPIR